MLAVGDTNLREVNGRSRTGLMGIATGLEGLFGRKRGTYGTFWEVMLAFDDRPHWSESSTRYVHTGVVKEGRDTTHHSMLSLRIGAGHRLPLGPGQLRFALTAAPLALEFNKYGGNRVGTFPILGIGAAYQWQLGP